MSSIHVYVVVEGPTEQTFIRDVLAPALAHKNLFLYAAVLGKPGHKGGNVRFDRAKSDIGNFLAQRPDTYITTMLDYFRIDPDWPGLEQVRQRIASGIVLTASQKAEILECETLKRIVEEFPHHNIEKRFLPYIEMHEFEALLFSDPMALSNVTGVPQVRVEGILSRYTNPEEINDNPSNAPSYRLMQLTRYRKVTMGNAIAKDIGIQKMRSQCPHFNEWVTRLEKFSSIY
ncbi:MAG: DUF4276 family protein [Chlorobiales bacterium]|nr:DUF4276 family protein [Chlorobiales bacterium]